MADSCKLLTDPSEQDQQTLFYLSTFAMNPTIKKIINELLNSRTIVLAQTSKASLLVSW